MSVDQMADLPPLPAADVDDPIEFAASSDPPPQLVGGHLPRVVVLTGVSVDTVETLLLAIARGNQEAFIALQSRMAGLVRVNVRRVLRDASRCEATTQETFAEVLKDALQFDPHRESAELWLLTRAHQRALDGLRSDDDTHDPQSPRIDQSAPMVLA